MKVKYIYSACLQIETSDLRVLTDPWFTEGIYGGSWFQYPRIDPFDIIEEPDYIYISHIHPDHYDPEFLFKIFDRYGSKPILIPDFRKNPLFYKAKIDGIEMEPVREFKLGNTQIFIEENDTGSHSDIDSALIVHDTFSRKSILNLNDCVFNETHVQKLKLIIDKLQGKLDLVALGYAGASAYPQTYFDIHTEKASLIKEADIKKQKGFDRYNSFRNFFEATYYLPFAGDYILGSHLAVLNEYRGVPDACDVKNFDDKALVFHPGGEINLQSNQVFNERDRAHSIDDINIRLEEISSLPLHYEEDFNLEYKKINFIRLISMAAKNGLMKSEIDEDYCFIFTILEDNMPVKKFKLLCPGGDVVEMSIDDIYRGTFYSELIIDYRLFFGLLIGFYHWNNADVGSLFQTRRYPVDNYDRSVQSFLNFFTIV